jgi:hypothetical protein
MANYNFNKIYVIESLGENDFRSGKALCDDILSRYAKKKNDEFRVELIDVYGFVDFKTKMGEILEECKEQGIYPMLHLEIHGEKNFSGLVLSSGELINWVTLHNFLLQINLVIGNHLFLTMAVCHGAYLMQIVKLDQPAPFFGFIGSFDALQVDDLMIRYEDFYSEFLETGNLENGFLALQNANPENLSDYKVITSEDIFNHVYASYVRENLSPSGIKKRKEDVTKDKELNPGNRKQRKAIAREFQRQLRITKEKFYRQHRTKFFMFDEFPENLQRFGRGEY